MKLVVDSNIVFSTLLNPKSSIGDILFNSEENIRFYTCEYLREEIRAHKGKLIQRAAYSEQEFDELEFLVYKQITFFLRKYHPF